MPMIALHFPVLGRELPTDHGYALYGALSRALPALHDTDRPIRIAPIHGAYVGGDGLMQLDRFSILRIRLPADSIPLLLPLAGKGLEIDGHGVRLGVPQVRALEAAPNLLARLVVIKASSPLIDKANKHSRDPFLTKRYLDPSAFLDAIRRELEHREIHAQADLPLHESGPRAGQPRRHILRIQGKRIVGFSVLVQGLTADESIRLQVEGLGGRGKMGCGFFVARKEDHL